MYSRQPVKIHNPSSLMDQRLGINSQQGQGCCPPGGHIPERVLGNTGAWRGLVCSFHQERNACWVLGYSQWERRMCEWEWQVPSGLWRCCLWEPQWAKSKDHVRKFQDGSWLRPSRFRDDPHSCEKKGRTAEDRLLGVGAGRNEAGRRIQITT